MERTRGLALWRQIAQELEREIASGGLGPGDRLPPEKELAVRFGVNRHTLRQAVAHLADRQLLRVEQGRGTFVQEQAVAYRIGLRTRLGDNIRSANQQPARRIVESEEIPARGRLTTLLRVPLKSGVLRLLTLATANDRPVVLGEHFFPASRFPDMETAVRETSSISEGFRRNGVPDYRRKWTRINARTATASEAQLLDIVRGRALIVTESLNVDGNDRPIEYGRSLFPADVVTLTVEG